VWNTVFGYLVFAALTWLISRQLSHGYFYAAMLTVLINISAAFFGYKWFVFKTQGNYLREWFRCFMVYGAAALPNLLLLPVVVNALIYVWHVSPGGNANHPAHFQFTAEYMSSTFLTAPYIGGAILTAGTVILSFFGHRHFSFRQPGIGKSESDQTDQQNSAHDWK
jgi:putative flippase GtrA